MLALGLVAYESLAVVPELNAMTDTHGDAFRALHDRSTTVYGGVVVLSGAGLSTESGIPDYRGPTGAARRATPMSLQTFSGSREARQRYWARSHLGWGLIATARPNDGHRAVAAMQESGLLAGIVTDDAAVSEHAVDVEDEQLDVGEGHEDSGEKRGFAGLSRIWPVLESRSQ